MSSIKTLGIQVDREGEAVLSAQKNVVNQLWEDVINASSLSDRKFKRNRYRKAYEIYRRQKLIVFGVAP